MSTIKDGGPAYPRNYDADGHNGMDLRDYFAAKAMQTFAMRLAPIGAAVNRSEETTVAQAAYQMADAMLAAREDKS